MCQSVAPLYGWPGWIAWKRVQMQQLHAWVLRKDILTPFLYFLFKSRVLFQSAEQHTPNQQRGEGFLNCPIAKSLWAWQCLPATPNTGCIVQLSLLSTDVVLPRTIGYLFHYCKGMWCIQKQQGRGINLEQVRQTNPMQVSGKQTELGHRHK